MTHRRTVFAVTAVLIAASSVLALPAAADLDLVSGDDAQVAYTEGDGVNVRAAPGINTDILTTLPEGFAVAVTDDLLILDDGSSWYAITTETYEGTATGWVSADYLTSAAPVIIEPPDDSDDAARGVPLVLDTGGEELNLRVAPALDAYVDAAIPDGALVEILAPAFVDVDGNVWSPVRYDGIAGYSATAYLTESPSSAPEADALATEAEADDAGLAIADEALDYLGSPYLWNGSTPDGFDCAGFTYYVFSELLGIDLPRAIEDQVESGVYVTQAELVPGDLIFFQNTYQWGLSHIGVYIGNGEFVSASGEHDAVGISDLNDPYWQARYFTARSVR
jgi:cell wall-associated NlpC family hydrolase